MSNIRIVFLTLFFLFQTAFSQTTLLTGQATHQVQVSGDILLSYTSDIDNSVKTRNEVSSGGWCGLGWKLGYPSISVAHNNTVDISDDRWFFDDGYGNTSEIIRSANTNAFFFKFNPVQRKVTVIDNNPAAGQLRIIKGWEMTSLDGTISRFGFITGQGEDMLPYLPCWGNYIGKGKAAFSALAKFFHRWPLRETEDVNHHKTVYTYSNLPGQTAGGFTYTRESYPQQITTIHPFFALRYAAGNLCGIHNDCTTRLVEINRE